MVLLWKIAKLQKDNIETFTQIMHAKLMYILKNSSDKFHIQGLNVCDKKYMLVENKREYYQQYRWVVCGHQEIAIQIVDNYRWCVSHCVINSWYSIGQCLVQSINI